MPEKALIVNQLALKTFSVCLYQLGGCTALSEVEVSLHPEPTGQCCSGRVSVHG